MDRPDKLTLASVRIAMLGPIGLWPFGPGTLASGIVALVWRLLPWPLAGWVVVVALWTAVGIPAADRAERDLGHDDSRIVIDEAVGMGIALLGAPRSWIGAMAAFVLFRVLDIAKPPPLKQLQLLAGGWGVVLDDVGAGALAAIGIAVGFAVL